MQNMESYFPFFLSNAQVKALLSRPLYYHGLLTTGIQISPIYFPLVTPISTTAFGPQHRRNLLLLLKHAQRPYSSNHFLILQAILLKRLQQDTFLLGMG